MSLLQEIERNGVEVKEKLIRKKGVHGFTIVNNTML